jgi:methionine-rich copper-binding protein CopC|tara:strand:- start:239 stop:628 length:390 start_codon:yes stop_codon:yes gene_type:complete
MKIMKYVSSVALLIFITVAFSPPKLSLVSYHFGVAKSTPAKDANVESVSRISIWFTQVPQENSVSIRLVDAGGSLVTDVDFETDQISPMLFTSVLDRALTFGSYKVIWRGIGQDGHAVTGDYMFTISAE